MRRNAGRPLRNESTSNRPLTTHRAAGYNRARPSMPEAPTVPRRADRRVFLQQAAGVAAGLAATAAANPADPLLPTVKLGPHALTRLIIGGNPVYGYSHFNRLLDRY